MRTPTPLGHRPLSVLPIVYRLWASVRVSHIQALFDSSVPDSVFRAGKEVSSVDAWYASTLGIEETLLEASEDVTDIFFVADAVESFDTVDRGIWDCASQSGGVACMV